MAKTKVKNQTVKTAAPKITDWYALSGKEYHQTRSRFIDYYYQEKKKSDLLPDVWVWCKNNDYSKDDIAILKSQVSYISGFHTALCKCLNLGLPDYNKDHADYWESLPGTSGVMRPISDFLHKSFRELIDKGHSGEQEEEESVKAPVKTIQQRMYEAACFMAKEIDEEETRLLENPENYDFKKFDPARILREEQAKAAHVKIINGFYKRDLDEMREVLNNDDEQLREAYSNTSKKAVRNIIKFYEEIDSACRMISEQQKSQRKPRQKRPPARDKIVSKLKYMKSFDQLKLVSIDPTKILDSKELWIYNTKTRKLGRYIVEDEFNTGLTLGVKGTSITGFKPDASIQKTLRKPEDKLKEFKEAGKVKLRKFMDEIKAVDTKMNGRLNENTILLKVL